MDNNLLNDRIGRLKKWEQKESLNEILFDALSSLNFYVNERFDTLTQEIRDESVLNNGAPVIRTAVCSSENIDNRLFLHPVSTEPPINSPDYITTIFVECDYHTIQELLRNKYTAEIRCKSKTFKIHVALRYSLKYLQKMESLYYLFNENEIPWATINGSYFYKFLDVYSTQNIGQADEFIIDFAQYEKYVSYDKTLLWNINPINAIVAACEVIPAYNTVQFEHTLKNLQLDEHRYLVCLPGDKFTYFRHGNAMRVRTYAKHKEQIKLLRIAGGEDVDNPLCLPPKSNKKKTDFINVLARGRYIPTRGEAERIIHSMNEEADVQVVDMKILPCTEANILRYKGIDYNYFAETKGFLTDRKLLLFTFKTCEDRMWAHEAMFFVLSELQLYFYEYRCVGEMP